LFVCLLVDEVMCVMMAVKKEITKKKKGGRA